LFGSVNLDMRSFWLNFEATLFIYNQNFTVELRAVQASYEKKSKKLLIDDFINRSKMQRFYENASLIVGPLL
ncbi:MAG: cardiolipin synthase, partial [Desulfocapsa sp.]|nr:cardiolipin synthase [Desulfocapsa sp.]